MKNTAILTKFFIKDLSNRKIFYLAFGIGLFFIIVSLFLAPLSYKESVRLATNFSLAGIQISLIFLSALVGADFIQNEIKEQILYSVLTRPVSRTEYYLCKFLAYLCCLLFIAFFMWLVFFIIAYFVGVEPGMMSLIPFLGILIESLLIFSFALFISMFSSSLLTIGASLSFFIIGHWVEVFKSLTEKSDSPIMSFMGWAFVWILPNLESLNWKSNMTYQEWLPLNDYLSFSFYGLVWALFFLVLGIIIFEKKDLV